MDLDERVFTRPLLIVGCVRNGAATIGENVLRLSQAFSKFPEVYWLLIESDSSDNSLEVLRNISESIPNFKYMPQGVLSEKIPLRTERLAYCRNVYLQEIKNNSIYKNVEYVVVSDFDDTNTLLTEEAILSCWIRTDWDVCTANQQGPYYDIWALRHPLWSPSDCWLEHRFLSQFSRRPSDLAYACVFSKMIELPPRGEWLEVDSAFGGMAIYRKSIMSQAAYIGLYENGMEVCEHVPFHLAIRAAGGKIYINPKLINTDYTEHSLPLKQKVSP
jgi:hypothetical protein